MLCATTAAADAACRCALIFTSASAGQWLLAWSDLAVTMANTSHTRVIVAAVAALWFSMRCLDPQVTPECLGLSNGSGMPLVGASVDCLVLAVPSHSWNRSLSSGHATLMVFSQMDSTLLAIGSSTH